MNELHPSSRVVRIEVMPATGIEEHVIAYRFKFWKWRWGPITQRFAAGVKVRVVWSDGADAYCEHDTALLIYGDQVAFEVGRFSKYGVANVRLAD